MNGPFIKIPNIGWDSALDTGFGNRIQWWEMAYDLNKHNDFRFTIIVAQDRWSETKYLDFPCTVSSQQYYELEYLQEINVRDRDWKKTLDTGTDWYIKNRWPPFGPKGVGYYGIWLHLITLKDKALESKIKEVVKDRIGIHIRHWPTIDTDPRPNSIPRFDYRSKMKQVKKVMDEYSNSKFYVSSDVTYTKPGGHIDRTETASCLPDFRNETHWISEIYKDYDVVDYRDIISVNDVVDVKMNVVDENNSSWLRELSINNEGLIEGYRAVLDNKLKGKLPYFSEDGVINEIYERKILRDVVDLFSLIYSREFIDSKETGPTSSWSDFVHCYRNRKE